MVAVLQRHKLRDFDWLLAILAIGIVSFGAWEIHNAQPTETFWQKQLIGLAVALVAMLAIAFTDYRRLVEIAPALYGVGLVLLLIVLIPHVGMKINGQRCWIKLPGAGQFQPSEFVKIPVVLMLARYFGKHRTGMLAWKEFLIGCVILGLPMGLILLEPDLGQAITYLPLLAIVLFLSSVRMWIVGAALFVCIAGAPLFYTVGVKTGLLHGYKLERINVILDPENADKRGFGYHTWQSMVTVGEGGLAGARNSEYSQSSLKFLPEPHTDFVLSMLGEELGFLGTSVIILLLALFVAKGFMIALAAEDPFGRYLAFGVSFLVAFHTLINVGMISGLLPTKGLPLPFLSYGGSSLVVNMIGAGMLISVSRDRQPI